MSLVNLASTLPPLTYPSLLLWNCSSPTSPLNLFAWFTSSLFFPVPWYLFSDLTSVPAYPCPCWKFPSLLTAGWSSWPHLPSSTPFLSFAFSLPLLLEFCILGELLCFLLHPCNVGISDWLGQSPHRSPFWYRTSQKTEETAGKSFVCPSSALRIQKSQ